MTKIRFRNSSDVVKLLFLTFSFTLIALEACKKAEQTSMVNKVANQNTSKDTLPDIGFDTDLFIDANTVDAHDERDTIYGNFTGRGKDMLYILKLTADSMTKYIDTTRVQNWNTYDLDEPIRYFLASDNPRIPMVELYACKEIPPKLVNEGDLDRNGRDEVGYLHTWLNSQYRMYCIFTMVGDEWRYLVDCHELFTPEWFRHSGKEIAEPGPRQGTVKINYGTFDPQYDDDGNYIGGLDLKDTIIVSDFPVIDD